MITNAERVKVCTKFFKDGKEIKLEDEHWGQLPESFYNKAIEAYNTLNTASVEEEKN